MINIQVEQVEALVAETRQVQREAIIRLLLRDCSGYFSSTTELQIQVDAALAAASVLGINQLDHMCRFIRVSCLPPSVWAREGSFDLTVRILTDTSVDAETRLRFVETNIVP